MAKTIYHYSPLTGEFIGSDQAREFPPDSGEYLIPAQATDKEPPEAGTNEVAIFVDDAWVLADDFRAVPLWDTGTGQPAKIAAIGVKPGSDLTELAPPDGPSKWNGSAWVADIAGLRAAKLLELESAYSAAIQHSVIYMNSTFQADADSQNTLCKVLAVSIAAAGVPQGFYWLDADNNKVTMTLAQLQGLAAAMMAQAWTAFQKLQSLKTAARAATTAQALAAIAW